MSYEWINSLITYFLKRRKQQIDDLTTHAIPRQEVILKSLLKGALHTRFGKQYDFKNIDTYQSFREKIPLHQYESLSPSIEKMRMGKTDLLWKGNTKWFAKSSGTTSKSKFIPVSNEAIEENHFNAGKDMLAMFIHNNQETKIFTGKNLRLGGSHEIYKESDTFFGDLSSIIIGNMPFWADFSSTPNQKTALMSEWDTKLEVIVDTTITQNITSLAGVPSWMLILLNRVLEVSGKKNILEVWPNLEVYFHGGVNFDPYRNQYEKLIPKKTFKYYEVYNASEGFFAIQDQNENKGLLLMLNHGIFYEFIPISDFKGVDSNAIGLNEVIIGINYAMVISTNSGLWRYIIGDVITFTSTHPYRIRIIGRTKSYINAFGEELMIHNAEAAITKACIMTNAMVYDYTVAPIFMSNGQGRHQWLVAFKQIPKDLELFKKILDKALQEMNSDYAAKRYKSITLNPLELLTAPAELFHDWLKKKGKIGGQHKVPRLANDRLLMEELLKMMSRKGDYQSSEPPPKTRQ